MSEIEVKKLVEDGNRAIEALRSAVESKADATTIANIEKSLADTLSAKSALEARLEAIETANARAQVLAGKGDEAADEYKSAFITALRKPTDHNARQAAETLAQKSVNITTPANGGFAVPSQIAAEIARVALDFSPMRQLARVVQVSTSDYVELLDNANAGFEWVGDTTTRTVTDAPTIAQIKPTMGEISAQAEISLQALEDIFFNVEAWIAASLGEKFGAAEGVSFISGNGTNKPTGLLSGAFGETVSGAAAAMPTNPDRLIDMFYALGGDYRSRASWLMNSGTLATVAKYKTTDGQYLLVNPLASGVAPTLLGKPVHTDESMPAVAAGATPIFLGDLQRAYLIADRVGISILPDPYSKAGFLTMKARKRVGGICKDTKAGRFLKIAAS